MSDNPYSPPNASFLNEDPDAAASVTPQDVESVKESRYRRAMKGLSWILMGYGAVQLVNAIFVLYQRSNSVGLDPIRDYSTFLMPALTIQSGLLLRDRSKWSIVTCLSVVAILLFTLISMYHPSKLDQRSIFRAVFETAPPTFFVLISGYSFVACILGFFWKAGRLR